MNEAVKKFPSMPPNVDLVFQNDPDNSHLYHNNFRGHTLAPERALLLAVLSDAIERHDTDWINRPGYEPWGFSFEYVCEHLGFDPDYIRSGVL